MSVLISSLIAEVYHEEWDVHVPISNGAPG